MSLLIVLCIPALVGIVGMAVAINYEVLYPRLKGQPARVLRFPIRIHGRRGRRAA